MIIRDARNGKRTENKYRTDMERRENGRLAPVDTIRGNGKVEWDSKI